MTQLALPCPAAVSPCVSPDWIVMVSTHHCRHRYHYYRNLKQKRESGPFQALSFLKASVAIAASSNGLVLLLGSKRAYVLSSVCISFFGRCTFSQGRFRTLNFSPVIASCPIPCRQKQCVKKFTFVWALTGV